MVNAKGKGKLNQSKGIRNTGSRGQVKFLMGWLGQFDLDGNILNKPRESEEVSQLVIWSKSAPVRGNSSASDHLL